MAKYKLSIRKYSKAAAALLLGLSTMTAVKPAQAIQIDQVENGLVKVTIDFENIADINGNNIEDLEPGQIISDQWSNYGLDISAVNDRINDTGTLMLFDSNCTLTGSDKCSGGDIDLGTGDSNVGSGLVTDDNILIIQETNNRGVLRSSPDDEAKGGTITFGFDVSKLKQTLAATVPNIDLDSVEVVWDEIRFIDVDKNPTVEHVSLSLDDEDDVALQDFITEMWANGQDPVTFAGIKNVNKRNGTYDLVDNPNNANDDIDTVGELNNLGENSVLDIDLSNIFTESFQASQELNVHFGGSGAISHLSYYYRYDVLDIVAVPTPAAILPVLGGLFGVAAKRKSNQESEDSLA